MTLNEISLAQLLNSTSGTAYFSMFAKLIGHSQDVLLYEGITDDHYVLLQELENKLGYELPSNYVDFLSYLNGGHFLDIDLFSLTDKNNANSLYGVNFFSKIRDKLEENVLVIGKYKNYIMYVDCEDDDGSYVLMDIRNNEKIEFDSFNSLIGFIFYVLTVNNNKKIEKEKEQIKEMREKLHKDIKLRESVQKREKIRNKDKLRAKTAAKALREKTKKSRK